MPTIDLGNIWQEKIFKFWRCSQRILMVADGSLGFSTGGFGLSEMVGVVEAAGHTVTALQRAGGTFFATLSPALTTTNYDQVWLFGFDATPMVDTEAKVVADFMQAGGGVFATGDHGVLGHGMGSVLPRVRKMRNWTTVDMDTPYRLDTVSVASGVAKEFEDQSDDIPQRIYPTFLSNGGSPFDAATWSPHPLLRQPQGAVSFLPDHPHESECFAPAPDGTTVTLAGTSYAEWPSHNGSQPSPQVVARSVSGGRFIVSGAPTATGTKPPVVPRCFGAISAYDGDAAVVGRIVCDATWHHFVNINLNGSGAPGRQGLYHLVGGSLVPTPEYLEIQRYYRNIAEWQAPSGRRWCGPFLKLAVARFDLMVLEELVPYPHPCPWDPMVRIGALIEGVLERDGGPGAAAEVVEILLASQPDVTVQLTELLRLRRDDDLAADKHLLPLDDLRRAVLGSITNYLLELLPTDPEELEAVLRRDHDEIGRHVVSAGTLEAREVAIDAIRAAVKETAELVEQI